MNDAFCSTCGAPLRDGSCARCLFGVLDDERDDGGALPGLGEMREIARGGMGVVYQAKETATGRIVAVKMPGTRHWDDADAMARFMQEARSVALLEHPHILPVYEVGRTDDAPYFTMKFAAGGSLAQQAKVQREKLGSGRDYQRWVAAVLAKVADAAQFAHERGVLHRDLKPGNILFDEAGKPYVSDFGLAKWMAGSALGEGLDLTRTVTALGTPQYMPPEIAAGRTNVASTSADIYALGAVLYELLCGRPPHEGESLTALLRHIAEQTPPPPARVMREQFHATLSPDLEAICLRAIEREPRHRYSSAALLADDLRRWLAGETVLARPVRLPVQIWRWARRRPAIAALLSLLGVVLVAGGAAMFAKNRQLTTSIAAERQNLRTSLISEARLQRNSGLAGQRFAALDAVRRSMPYGVAQDTRDELAGALARTDLRLRFASKLNVRANGNHIAELSPSLALCAHALPTSINAGWVLVDTRTGEVKHRFPTTAWTHRFIFSQDERRVAALASGKVEIWSADGGDAPLETLDGLGRQVGGRCFAFLPDGGWICAKQDGSLWIKRQGASEAVPFAAASGSSQVPVYTVALLDSPLRLAVLRAGCSLEVWDVAKEQRLMQSAVPARTDVQVIEWHPSGAAVYLAENEKTNRQLFMVRVDAAAGSATVFPGTRDAVASIAADPHGQFVASLADDGSVRLMDARSGQPVLTRGGCGDNVLRFSKDGQTLAVSLGEGEVGFFAVERGDVWHDFDAAPGMTFVTGFGLALDQQERLLFSAGIGGVRAWDLRTHAQRTFSQIPAGEFLRVLIHPVSGELLLFHPVIEKSMSAGATLRTLQIGADGGSLVYPGGTEVVTRALTGFDNLMQIIGHQGTWIIYNYGTWTAWPEGDRTRAVPLTKGVGNVGALSDDGRLFVVADAPPSTRVSLRSGVQGGAILDTATCSTVPVIVFSRDGGWLVAGTADATEVWSTAGGKLTKKRTFPKQRTYIRGQQTLLAAFSSDSRLLALHDREDAVRIISLPDLRERVLLSPPHPVRINSLLLNADSSRLFIQGVGERVYEWDLAALRREFEKEGIEW